MTEKVSDAEFEQKVLTGNSLVLVDFGAEWCEPCKALNKVLDSLASEFQGQVSVYEVDVEQSPETAAKFGVRGLPTILVFKKGKVVNRLVGAKSRQVLTQTIKNLLWGLDRRSGVA